MHGSAPDIAGKGIANPTGAILSGAMMLEWLGEAAAATQIRQAIARTLAAGHATPDIGGAATTTQFTDAVDGAPRRLMIWRVAVPLLAGAIVALLPAPPGLGQAAWYYVAVFTAVILGLITEPLPPSAVGFIGVTVAAAAGLPFSDAQRAAPGFRLSAEAVRWALAGFSNSTVWLIFAAFVFAMGYEKTGLGRRIALVMVRTLGHRTLGLGYAVAFSDVLLAPFTPSNTARSAGMIFPVIRNIPELYGSGTGQSARQLGTYLMWVAFATTCVTSSMFVTALAPNLLLLDLARTSTGVEITWTAWFVGFLPMGVALVLLVPWITFRLHPPETRTQSRGSALGGDRAGRHGGHQPQGDGHGDAGARVAGPVDLRQRGDRRDAGGDDRRVADAGRAASCRGTTCWRTGRPGMSWRGSPHSSCSPTASIAWESSRGWVAARPACCRAIRRSS